jgi:hypothetical protein
MRLADICTVQIGYTARSRLEPADAGGVLALQLRDVAADGEVRLETLSRVVIRDVAQRYLVSSGDVIFRSRGDRTTATVMSDAGGEAIAVILPLVILRPDRAIATPDFIAWSINLPSSQRHLDATSQGGSVRMVSKSALDELQIDVPDLATQHRIGAAAALARREAVLAASLAEKQLTLTTLALANAAKRGSAIRPSARSKP